mgnify:CR=1 FL=1
MISNYDKQVDIGRKIFLNYDQDALIQKYTLDADADFLYLTYLGTKCRINRKTGAIDEMIDDIYTECREYTVVMTIYDMLCHSDNSTASASLLLFFNHRKYHFPTFVVF